jgi:hypothetical protein
MRGTVGSGEQDGGAGANRSDVVDRFEQGVLEFILWLQLSHGCQDG